MPVAPSAREDKPLLAAPPGAAGGSTRARIVDLHTHTTASDGTDTPRGLIRKAAEAGLAAVAVTDHDTISGLDEAEAAGRDFGVEVIRGCELGVQGQYGEIHLLGLWLPPGLRAAGSCAGSSAHAAGGTQP